MPDTFQIQLNGQTRTLTDLADPVPLDRLIESLGLKADRIAVECNGTIAPRAQWPQTNVSAGDKLEIVHFVGGGVS